MALELAAPTAVVCHDAGAANIIQAWMADQPRHDWRPYMNGPAERSWRTLGLDIRMQTDLIGALDGAASLLTGSGWASDLEHQARRIAKAKGLYSVAVLDHWVNYPERFTRDGETVLPDALYVTDDYAYAEALRCFPGIPVHRHKNLYLEQQLRQIQTLGGDAGELLYLLEPIRAPWPRHVAGEFEALDYFITHLDVLGVPSGTPLRLRPHPSDPPGKYDEWMAAHADLNPVLDDSPSLAAALSRARWVAGCETVAMTVALAAGRTVVSTLPPWAPPCRLPHDGIICLSRME